MAGVAGHGRWTRRICTRSGKARVDFARHCDHTAADLFTRAFIAGEVWWTAGVTEPAIHLQGVAEVLHDRARAVNFGPRRQNLQVGRRFPGRHESFGVVLVEE